MKVAEQMHAAVRLLHAVNRASLFGGFVTVTIGIGVGKAEIGTCPTALIDVADRALYQAKQMGRNRTCTQSLAQQTYANHESR
jgi:PleD family two-component response regulator